MRKVLFFDIDGTIVPENTRYIPESVKRAIWKAKEKGHLLFVNTGRTICRVIPEIKELPFDGYLCGCGSYLTYHGKVFYEKNLTSKMRKEIMDKIVECNIDGVFENSENVYYFDKKSRFEEIEDLKVHLLDEGIGTAYNPDNGECDFDKMYTTTDEKSDVQNYLISISKYMDVIDRGHGAYEAIPKGCSKSTAMDMIYEKFQIKRENSYAFGDSSNDLPMFQNSVHNIAMGVHSSALEPYTEFVTKTIEEDGLEYAMKYYGLI